jgi:hypothetical protein
VDSDDGPSADLEPLCTRLVAQDEADEPDALSLEHSDTRLFRFDL